MLNTTEHEGRFHIELDRDVLGSDLLDTAEIYHLSGVHVEVPLQEINLELESGELKVVIVRRTE